MMKIAEFFQDNSGGLSSTRLAFLTWTMGVFLVWGFASYQAKSVQAIPDSVIVMMGVVSGAKCVQRFGEKSVEVDPTKPQ
jgi:hypothetical protein